MVDVLIVACSLSPQVSTVAGTFALAKISSSRSSRYQHSQFFGFLPQLIGLLTKLLYFVPGHPGRMNFDVVLLSPETRPLSIEFLLQELEGSFPGWPSSACHFTPYHAHFHFQSFEHKSSSQKSTYFRFL